MDLATKKKTLRLLSNGMYVMTARSGNDYGAATVTWVSQASFKPPLLMAAIRPESNLYQCLRQSGAAAVHIVAFGQNDVAQRFFFPTRVEDHRINGEPFIEGMTGSPILINANAAIECRVARIVPDLGDHAVVILEVVEAQCREEVRPLTIAESPWRYGG